jgi:outer membrane receptor for ferrienterochelin and colicins
MIPILRSVAVLLLLLGSGRGLAQTAAVSGRVLAANGPLAFASVSLSGTSQATLTDSLGQYSIGNLRPGHYKLSVSAVGFETQQKTVTLATSTLTIDISLKAVATDLGEVVITGTMKEVGRSQSPVSVEVYSPAYFKKNPTPSIYEALQNVNGVRPQLNCNVCNTGDIHINGMEGPYTMVLIDGMPIVSALSTVYGLSGIPNSLIERVEVVKGPASSLYGSEAVGGLINIITKKPSHAPLLSADVMATSWQEYNADIGFKLRAGNKASVLTGINYFNFNNRVDNNADGFTDMTLQQRISLFQKWSVQRSNKRLLSLAGRYMYEDRWGGDVRWNKQFRGGDSLYGESIYTKRWELMGLYQLPVKEKMMLAVSYNQHDQNSVYGTTLYNAQQTIAFAQLTWDKAMGPHDLLLGLAFRYTYYDDNTPATAQGNRTNQPQKTALPGVFVQDEWTLAPKHKLLMGFRYDHNSYHGHIYTPRIGYKWSLDEKNILRLNAGTGFRVVNLFTEDHAALTGARVVEIKNDLAPERSLNANLNYVKKMVGPHGGLIGLDASLFYTYFSNRIIADYDTDPNKIIYDNLGGHAISKGMSLNVEIAMANGIKLNAGGTLMENTITNGGKTEQQILSENFTGTWAVSYKIKPWNLALDYTGNVYSPMRLPLLGPSDPRRAHSPWWSIQNIQAVFSGLRNIEIYSGVKNLLNWTPNRGNPFIIARSHDPFDKEVQFDVNGQVLATPNNPHALTFDPTYVYGPNQGLRLFLGVRVNIR